ncbi:ABC transporter ATP-binding protein [Bacillus sp. S/N-304-OC-R1]|uniref:ABC transporter ATP-binding protein n=1 Tax=Bacillus sp. S/N-304-OC-R1 TaxID=2758034 RepID=UPI001C8EB356|nr:ABC transporter ATP-binding protein [Bacillus sp. S/N-304-OC-R1]
MTNSLLQIENLHVSFHTFAGEVKAVRGVNFTVNKGEAVAIVGESGCGKSVTAKSIMKLLPTPPTEYKSGKILFNGQNLLEAKEPEMKKLRGNKISMIFQDPMSSLNPTSKIGDQLTEGLMKHKKLSRTAALQHAVHLLERVGIPQAKSRLNHYPHEFSGGMRQRVMIAMALACDPELIIADEPTTALDVTIQAQILNLMKRLQKETNTSIILITHDLGVVAEVCDKVIVMYAGEVVEAGTVEEIFRNPTHPYTKGLMKSIPRLDMDRGERLFSIIGSPPDLLEPPKGCSFFPRCEYAMKVCKDIHPALENINGTQQSACWLHHPKAQAAAAKAQEVKQ